MDHFIQKNLLFLPFIAMVVLAACVSEAKPESLIERQTIQFELSRLDDGTYRGSYAMADTEYTVDITVEAHVIKGISIIKGPERVFTRKCGLCEAIAMIREVIGTQSLPVDAYSGATQTTTALLRAVEKALTLRFEGPDDASTRPEAWR